MKDKNWIDLDKHSGTYVPDADGFDSGVRIRRMLYHTSGMPDFLQIKAFCEKYVPGPVDKK